MAGATAQSCPRKEREIEKKSHLVVAAKRPYYTDSRRAVARSTSIMRPRRSRSHCLESGYQCCKKASPQSQYLMEWMQTKEERLLSQMAVLTPHLAALNRVQEQVTALHQRLEEHCKTYEAQVEQVHQIQTKLD
jgi:hypothetical protein